MKKNFKPGNEKHPKDLVVVKKDDVGKAADKYLELKESKRKMVEDIREAEKVLIKKLLKAERKSITVGGYALSINTVESKTKIKIAKA